jgi:acyl-CoA reductase-like NAD-dependent aldehyde dehydrogenase
VRPIVRHPPRLSELYIDGDWVASTGAATIDVVNPTTGGVVAQVPSGTVEDVDRAVAAARRAFDEWSQTPVAERASVLREVSAQISQRIEEIARAAATDIGTPLAVGRFMHAQLPATTFADMADNIERFELEKRDGSLMLVREPVGLVAAITPWNYPMHQIAAKVAPALAAGCTVVVKPSEVAPLSAWQLGEILAEAGLPAGAFNLVSGLGPVVGEALARHPGVDMVSFTGSLRAGTRVAELAAAGVKRVTLELGGKSPNVVLDDAEDLPLIVQGAIRSAFLNSGQTCSALTRLIVPRQHLPEVERLAVEQVERERVGDPTQEETNLGPVVSQTQHERVLDYINQGIKEGARLVIGGPQKPDRAGDGYFVAPTVFSDVRSDMTIAQEEIFGPVLVVMPYDSEEEAIEIANGTPYGLSGGVWSSDRDRAERAAKRLRTGQIKLNGAAFNPTAPFGGYKQSGIGRELGAHGLQEYFETKALII